MARQEVAGSGRIGSERGLRVCLLVRDEPGTTGTSRYVDSLTQGLRALSVQVRHVATLPTGALARTLRLGRVLGMDVNTFLAQYPLRVCWPMADVYHLSVQTYAIALLTSPPPGPTVVTVHDIIPHLVRHDVRLSTYKHAVHRVFDRLAMEGLRRADALIADSAWTRQTLVEHLTIPAERITVIPLGTDPAIFRPRQVPASFRERYGLQSDRKYGLYVGSEDPRKDLPTLWRAFARVRAACPDAQLLKVGASHHPRERERLNALAAALGIHGAVRFFDQVPEDDLPLFYCAASVYVQPSLYEGFGLPVLEALTCATPVVCAATSALVEIRVRGVTFVPPGDDAALGSVLKERLGADAACANGHSPATSSILTWWETAQRHAEVYEAVRSAGGEAR